MFRWYIWVFKTTLPEREIIFEEDHWGLHLFSDMGIRDSDPMDQENRFLLSGECWMCLWFILLGLLSAFFFPGQGRGWFLWMISADFLVLWLPVGFSSWEHLQEIRGREERNIRAFIYHRIAAFITQISELLSGDPVTTLSVQELVTSLFLFILLYLGVIITLLYYLFWWFLSTLPSSL